MRNMICGVTGKPANFTKSCKNFLLDREARDKRLKNIRHKIDQSLKAQESIYQSVVLEHPVYEYLATSPITLQKGELSFEILEHKRKRFIRFLAGIAICSIGLAILIYLVTNLKTPSQFLVPLILFAIGGNEIVQYTKSQNLTITQDYLIIGGRHKFKWSNILFLYFNRRRNGSVTTDYLIVHLSNGKEVKVNVSKLDISKRRLGQLLYTCMKILKPN